MKSEDIKVVIENHSEKLGCAAARNRAFDRMKEEIDLLTFADVDDRYDPKKLELQEKRFQTKKSLYT